MALTYTGASSPRAPTCSGPPGAGTCDGDGSCDGARGGYSHRGAMPPVDAGAAVPRRATPTLAPARVGVPTRADVTTGRAGDGGAAAAAAAAVLRGRGDGSVTTGVVGEA